MNVSQLTLFLDYFNFQFLGNIISKEVSDLLVVNLDIADPDVKQSLVILLGLLALKYVNNGSGYQSWLMNSS